MSGKHLHASYRVGEHTQIVDLRLDGATLSGTVDGEAVHAEVAPAGEGEIVLRIRGRRVLAVVARRGATLLVSVEGATHEIERIEAGAEAVIAARDEPFATSPMAGLLAKVHVAAGAAVAKGAPLFAVEAMKMEYVVVADRDAVVSEVRRKAGDRVTMGEVVVVLDVTTQAT